MPNVRRIARLASSFSVAVSTGPLHAGDAGLSGEIAWSRPTIGAASVFPPALGQDGTIYTSNGGAVTAFDPDGTLLWSVAMETASGPISVAPDGAILATSGPVGANHTIHALNPDGSTKWMFDAGASIHAGPNVGPDGTIYAVADTWFGGAGFFALDGDGNMLWSDPGDPALSADTGQPHAIVFGDSVAFLAMTPQGGSNGDPPVLWAFDLTAQSQSFTLTGSCQGQPVVNPLTGHLVTGNGLCQTIESRNAATGTLLWSVPAPSKSPCSGLANIAAGPDGSIYTAFCYRAFWSLTDDGAQRWFNDDFEAFFQMNRLAVAPDSSVVLDLGGAVGVPGWVRAFDPVSGVLQWQIDLELSIQKATSTPVFDLASGRAYFNVNRFGENASDLVAIELPMAARCTADLNASGAVDIGDLLIVLAAWGGPNADLDSDGITGISDLVSVLSAWGPCT